MRENRREEEIKVMVKGLLERLMVEERTMYLEEHPITVNGYYTRDLPTAPSRTCEFSGFGRGDFRPAILPKARGFVGAF